MSQASDHHRAIFKESSLDLDTESTEKLATLYGNLEKFITEDLADGFQLRDIYSLIVAVMNGLELAFADDAGSKLKGYAIFIVNRLIAEPVAGGIVPSEVSMLLHFVSIGTVIDLVSNLTKYVPFVNRFRAAGPARHGAASQPAVDPHDNRWIKKNWVSHGKTSA
ncbi:hypothetical protein HDV00_004492 [Rhizophlyctis rosea]|nr:hypothetical protein HDV00_004492 [Rhizophlyctis rosea]